MAQASTTPSSPRQERATIAVVGLGGIGSVIAGCLRHADRHDVVVCVRKPIERLVLERPEDTVQVAFRALVSPPRRRASIGCCCARRRTRCRRRRPGWARLCDASTRVAVLQNGIEHAARIAPFANGATAVSTVVYYNGERLGAGPRPPAPRHRARPGDGRRCQWPRVGAAPRRHAAAAAPERRSRHPGLAQAADQRRRQPDHHAHATTAVGAAARGHARAGSGHPGRGGGRGARRRRPAGRRRGGADHGDAAHLSRRGRHLHVLRSPGRADLRDRCPDRRHRGRG